MFNTSKNPRVKRSLDRIAMATYSLCKTTSLRDLTVTAIAKKAGVTRKTFYRNFDDVIDVIDYGFASHVVPLYKSPQCETFYDFLLSILGFASNYKDLLVLCEKQEQFSLLTRLGLKYLASSSYVQFVCSHHTNEQGFESTFSLLVASFTAALIQDWVSEGFKDTASQVASKGASALKALGDLD
jgi:AcrR family transcriptional regulator